MKKLENYIKCPKCNAEYVLSEIFYPNSLLGRAKEVVKSPEGIIEGIIGEDANLEETYVCDFCNSPFKVTANISFNSQVISFDKL